MGLQISKHLSIDHSMKEYPHLELVILSWRPKVWPAKIGIDMVYASTLVIGKSHTFPEARKTFDIYGGADWGLKSIICNEEVITCVLKFKIWNLKLFKFN